MIHFTNHWDTKIEFFKYFESVFILYFPLKFLFIFLLCLYSFLTIFISVLVHLAHQVKLNENEKLCFGN